MSWKKVGADVNWNQSGEKQQYPRIRWNHGRKVGRAGDPGVFYVKSDYMTDIPDGWTASNLFPNEDGYECPGIALVPILKRSQPFSTVDNVTTWHKTYERDKGMKIYTEMVCLLRGYPHPVILTTKGWIAGRIHGAKNSVFADHAEYVVKVANAQAEKPLSQSAFWIEFGGAYDSKGAPVFVEVGSGSQKAALHDVVLYARKGDHLLYGMKEAQAEAEIDRLYIGDERYKQAAALREELIAAGWVNERRGNLEAEPEPEKPKTQPKTYTPEPGAMFEDESPF